MSVSLKFFASIALTVLIVSTATAQLTLEEFLRSALEDPEVKTFDTQIEYLNGKPYRLSPLREIQFRTQNREMLQTQQEYGIRLSPANPWEMRRQNQYFKEFNNSLSYEREIVLKEALISRYLAAIDYIYYSEHLVLNTEMSNKLQQQLRILEKQSGSSYFDAEDFVDLTIDQLDFVVEVEETSFELSNQANEISRLYQKANGSAINWKMSDWIGVDRIMAVVDSLESASLRSRMLAYQEQKIRLAQSEYKLEQSNFNLGFVQTSYDRRRVNQDRNPFSVSVGVSIPLFNPNKGDMAKRKLEIIEAEYDLKEETEQSEVDKLLYKDKVVSLATRIKGIDKRIDEIESSTLPHTLSTIKGGDPVVFIRFGQQVDKLKELSLKVKRELLVAYVEYLAFNDVLQQQPLTNFLSPTLTPAHQR
jgi:hypothetical protein